MPLDPKCPGCRELMGLREMKKFDDKIAEAVGKRSIKRIRRPYIITRRHSKTCKWKER